MRKKEKIAARDSQVPIPTKRAHFLTSKQKGKYSAPIQSQDDWKDESNVVGDDSNEKKERLKTDARVGAFAITGIHEGTSDVEEPSLPDRYLSMTQRIQGRTTSLTITSTRELDKDNPTDVNAVAVDGPITKPFRRHRLIFVVSSLLLVLIVILAVIRTRRTSHFDSAAGAFLEHLKPLLTKTSRQELEMPGSVPALALTWLLKNSNFNDYPLPRQVQRFAMAAFCFSTEGRAWHQSKGWLTDDDECTWYQSSNKGLCVNTTLQILALKGNNLRGLLPNNIALLSSIKVLDLDSNDIRGTIPSEIGQSTELTRLDLHKNMLEGELPSEIGQCSGLKMLDLSNNYDLYGSIPSEIGQCIELTELYLGGNTLQGSIPCEIGQCKGLTMLDLSNSFDLHGFIPSEIGQCVELRELNLNENSLYGSIPSEISAFIKLENLSILNTSLSGTIPENLCRLEVNLNVGSDVECSCC